MGDLLVLGVFQAQQYDTPPSRQIVLPLARAVMLLPAKFADEALDYRLDWSTRLDGDTIVSAVATMDFGDVVVSRIIFNETCLSFWLGSGRSGNGSQLRCEVTTAGGRCFEQIFTIRCL